MIRASHAFLTLKGFVISIDMTACGKDIRSFFFLDVTIVRGRNPHRADVEVGA